MIDWNEVIDKTDLKAVTVFRGDYFFLSNMSPLEIPATTPYGELPTTEHIYLFYKSDDADWKQRCCYMGNPFKLKRETRKGNSEFKLTDKWNDVYRIKLMWHLVLFKFGERNPKLKKQLKELKDFLILEGNSHGDTFFGVIDKTHKGRNILGLLLMYRCWMLNDEDSECALIKAIDIDSDTLAELVNLVAIIGVKLPIS